MDKHTESAASLLGRLSPASTMEEVDAWLAQYIAAGEAARAESLRVERLHDAAHELLQALYMSVAAFEGDRIDEIESDYGLGTAQRVAIARAALSKALGDSK